jgi:hypothetical protein
MQYIKLLKNIFLTSFSIMGGLWIVVQIMYFFWKNQISWLKSNEIFLLVFLISFISSIIINLPFKKIRIKISGTEVYLTLKKEDILKSKGHMAVSSSNFFNTDPNIIAKKSVIAQIIEFFFNGNNMDVEKGIENSLANIKFEEQAVSRGKNKSYPIGTIASFDINRDKRVFLMAITKISETNGNENIESNISYIHKAINNLWDKADKEIDNGVLNIIPFGTGISKAFNRNVESILYIVQSFIDRAKKKRPCSELIIHIKQDDISLDEYIELKKIVKFLA